MFEALASPFMLRVGAEVDQWQRLKVYRQRYSIEDRLDAIASLEKSMGRRRMKSAALARRLEELQKQIAQIRSELSAVDSEIEESRRAGALLIEEILDKVQIEMGEAWSPAPVTGFRVWRIEGNQVLGNQLPWTSPTLESMCLREIPGEDLPHPVERCGPPACGIYAVKDLDMFPPDVAGGEIRRSVVGLVAMSGKVIEHEEGYRARTATAVAVSANDGEHRLLTTDRASIEDLFNNPGQTLAKAPTIGDPDVTETREFLESAQAKEDTWT